MIAADLPPDALAWDGLTVAPTLAELEAEAQEAAEDRGNGAAGPPVSLRTLAIAVYDEAERNGDDDWRHMDPADRAAGVAGRILWAAGAAPSLARAGFTGPGAIVRYLDAMAALEDPGATDNARRHARAVLSLAEMLAAEIPTPTARVAGLLPGEGFGILAGPRKHGKTLTELQLGLCVAGGVPFLGRAVEQTPVLIIEEEGAARAMQDRLRGQAAALGVPADAPLHIAHRQRFRLDHPADVDAIDELIVRTGAGLVIIGPLAQVASIDENSNSVDGMGPIVRTMTDLAARHRALVMLVHHLRKPVGASQAPKSVDEFFYRVRGADALVAGVDVALGLWREPDATDGTLYVLARDGENVRIPLLFDPRTLTFAVNPEPDDPMAADVARFVGILSERLDRWYTRAELEGATGWGRTKVLSVGMYAFGQGRAEQRTIARNAREWRVSADLFGGSE
jgi:hypothetical protein